MVSIEEVLDLMDENRDELDRRVGRICANPDINEERRRQLLAAAWRRAIRRHYQLLDAYLLLRRSDPRLLSPVDHQCERRRLHAPARPPGVPESARASLRTREH